MDEQYLKVEEMIDDAITNPEHMVEILEAATEIELSGLAVALCNMLQNDRPSLREIYAASVAEVTDTLVTEACIAAAAYEDECNGFI